MTPAETVRHNARLIREKARGKTKEERWKLYACLMVGMMYPVVAIGRIWHDDKVAFTVDTSMTWAKARNR